MPPTAISAPPNQAPKSSSRRRTTITTATTAITNQSAMAGNGIGSHTDAKAPFMTVAGRSPASPDDKSYLLGHLAMMPSGSTSSVPSSANLPFAIISPPPLNVSGTKPA